MIQITVRLLGAFRKELGRSSMAIEMPCGAVARDLEPRLQALGVDLDGPGTVVTLNGRGLRQWPPEQALAAGDVVTVFPLLLGG